MTKKLKKQILTFLKKATSNDGALSYAHAIQVTGRMAIATEGHRLHLAYTPEPIADDGYYLIEGGELIRPVYDPPFPDWKRVWNKSYNSKYQPIEYSIMDANIGMSTGNVVDLYKNHGVMFNAQYLADLSIVHEDDPMVQETVWLVRLQDEDKTRPVIFEHANEKRGIYYAAMIAPRKLESEEFPTYPQEMYIAKTLNRLRPDSLIPKEESND